MATRQLWAGPRDAGSRPGAGEPPIGPLRPPPEPARAPASRTPRSDPNGDDAARARAGARRPLLAGAAGGALAAALVAAGALLLADGGGDPAPIAAVSEAEALAPARGASTATGRVYAAASPSVVSVRAGGRDGTGFVVGGDGTIVTNAHVVDDADRVQVRFGEHGARLVARVAGRDPSTDIAVLRVDAGSVAGVRPLALADSDAVRVGDRAIAVGNPLGLDRTATAGIVSGLEREIDAPNGLEIDEVIQTDAPINPGTRAVRCSTAAVA